MHRRAGGLFGAIERFDRPCAPVQASARRDPRRGLFPPFVRRTPRAFELATPAERKGQAPARFRHRRHRRFPERTRSTKIVVTGAHRCCCHGTSFVFNNDLLTVFTKMIVNSKAIRRMEKRGSISLWVSQLLSAAESRALLRYPRASSREGSVSFRTSSTERRTRWLGGGEGAFLRRFDGPR